MMNGNANQTRLPPLSRFMKAATEFGQYFIKIVGYQHSMGKTILNENLANEAVEYSLRGPLLQTIESNPGVPYDKLPGRTPTDVINNFLSKTYPYWERIHSRKEEFFLENLGFFLQGTVIQQILVKPLIDNLTKEQRDSIWDYLQVLVKISIHYIYEEKGGSYQEVNGMRHFTFRYKDKFKELLCYEKYYTVDLEKYIELYKVKI